GRRRGPDRPGHPGVHVDVVHQGARERGDRRLAPGRHLFRPAPLRARDRLARADRRDGGERLHGVPAREPPGRPATASRRRRRRQREPRGPGDRRRGGRQAGGARPAACRRVLAAPHAVPPPLAAVGFGALRLLHADVSVLVTSWADRLNIDPQNRYIGAALSRLLSADTRSLVAISVGSFIYAALLLTEATGLWLRRRWAEYFTIIVTGSFIPLEIYEVSRRVTATRL